MCVTFAGEGEMAPIAKIFDLLLAALKEKWSTRARDRAQEFEQERADRIRGFYRHNRVRNYLLSSLFTHLLTYNKRAYSIFSFTYFECLFAQFCSNATEACVAVSRRKNVLPMFTFWLRTNNDCFSANPRDPLLY